jgi:hypothetical protein
MADSLHQRNEQTGPHPRPKTHPIRQSTRPAQSMRQVECRRHRQIVLSVHEGASVSEDRQLQGVQGGSKGSKRDSGVIMGKHE